MDIETMLLMLDYLHTVADHVPGGLESLADALACTCLELTAYCRLGVKLRGFEAALAFAKSIPIYTDFESDEFTSWMLDDLEHLKIHF